MSTWADWVAKFCVITILAVPIALSGAFLPLSAQELQEQVQPQQQQPQQQQPQQQLLTQEQIQQLVAPIALYPDPLLAQVLTASTYPLEVAMAARWSEKNPNLKGSALEDAMQQQPWDPSVKGLTAVPQVLAMMDDKLDWTNQLGEAFLAQPDDVQNAIQALRAKAEAAGNLKSSKEQRVRRVAATPSPDYVGPPEYIEIEPVEPDYIYVPVYDPVIVYGIDYWPPAYVPFFWYPPWWTVGPAFGFEAALFVGPALWYHYNWGHGGYGAIQVNTVSYSKFNKAPLAGGGQFQTWKFDPAHHKLPFKNTKLQQQFGNVGSKGVQGIQTGKGVQGIRTGKDIQGIQTGKGIQGVESGKRIKGVESGKRIKGVETGKRIKGVETGKRIKGVESGKRIKGVETGKRIKGVETGKRIKGVEASRHIQTGKGFHGMSVSKRIQGSQGGSKGKSVRDKGIRGGH